MGIFAVSYTTDYMRPCFEPSVATADYVPREKITKKNTREIVEIQSFHDENAGIYGRWDVPNDIVALVLLFTEAFCRSRTLMKFL